MKKKILFIVAMVVFMFLAPNVNAKEIEVSNDSELVKAISEAESNDIIKLKDNITHEGSYLMFNKKRVLTLDMNGFNLTATDGSKLIVVDNANLTITGKGTITNNTHQAINVWGSEEKVSYDYSVLTVDKDVTLKGLTGIGIFYDVNNAYGVKVNFSGKIDVTNIGITTNGNIKHENGPVINILDGAVIKSKSVGLYVAGNSSWTIGNATVEGVGSAIAIKSGEVTINGGSYTVTGVKVSQPDGQSNGIEDSGATIQIETNDKYYGNISLVINDGEFNSKNYSNILEYIYTGDTTAVKKIEINGGTFNANSDEAVLTTIASDFALKFSQFVTGGKFSGDVSSLVKAGYKSYIDSESAMMIVEEVDVNKGDKVLSGKVTGSTNNDLITVQLKQGSKVLQVSKLDKDGNYKFEDVDNGVYNIVVVDLYTSKTLFVKVNGDTKLDIEINSNDITSNKVIIVGDDELDVVVDGIDKIEDATDVTVIVGKVTLEEDDDEVIDSFKDVVSSDNYEFIEIYVVTGEDVAEELDKALMFAIPFDFSNKESFSVSRYHNEEVEEFEALDEMPLEYVDGTYYADRENGMLYVFSSKFSLYALSYDIISAPQTGDNILVYVSIAIVSIIGIVAGIIYTKRKLYN